MISYILAAITGVLVLVADQFSKHWILNYYSVNGLRVEEDSFALIPGIFNIYCTNNSGAAWSMFAGHTWFLLSVTIVVMLVCIALLLKYGVKDKLMFWAMMLVLSGGLGNMIDRIFRDGEVIDFIQLDFWKSYPIFNFADCAIVIGACLLLLYFFKDIIKDMRSKQAAAIARAVEHQKEENQETQQDENV